MSEQIRIELHGDTIFPGGILRGTASVNGDLSKAKAIDCRLGYTSRLHSGFSEVVKGEITHDLARGSGSAVLPFEVKLPENAPISYDGQKVSIEWVCEVSLDVPWAIDPKAQVPFTVRPRLISEEVASSQPLPAKPEGAASSCLGYGCGILLILLLIMFTPHMVILAAIAGPPYLIYKLLQWMKVSQFSFKVEPLENVMPGSEITYHLEFTSRTSFEVTEITITLLGEEVWTTGSGKHQTTHRHPFLSETRSPCQAVRLPAGRFQQKGSFVLPPFLPTSVLGRIEYHVAANIDIPWWPDVGKSWDLKVIGVVADEAALTAGSAGFSSSAGSSDESSIEPLADSLRDSADLGDSGSLDSWTDSEEPEFRTPERCPSCGAEVRDDFFCPRCGERLRS